jgi:hypothetical protein
MILMSWGVKLLVSIDISTHAPWIMLNEQHIMACTSTNIVKLYWDARFFMSHWPLEEEEEEEDFDEL